MKRYNGVTPLYQNCVNVNGRIYTPTQKHELEERESIAQNLHKFNKDNERELLGKQLVAMAISGLLVVGFILTLEVLR